MRRTRHVIAVVVVATALCAQRGASAAPASQPGTPGLARTLVGRLTSGLKRTLPSARVQPIRRDETVQTRQPLILQIATGIHRDYSPFQFRLPPPALQASSQ
jgi:hypothetical protein